MARSTGSHALPVGWGDFVRVKALLAFAGILRTSAGISLASAGIRRTSAGIFPAFADIPSARSNQALQKWRAWFYSAPTAFFVGLSIK